jgi:hypothetical protein
VKINKARSMRAAAAGSGVSLADHPTDCGFGGPFIRRVRCCWEDGGPTGQQVPDYCR